jgi:deoxyribodipyrimidine photo-lyase
LPVFIFDSQIIHELPIDDARITFIYSILQKIGRKLNTKGSSLQIYKGSPVDVFNRLLSNFDIHAVFSNCDYEPYALERDRLIERLLKSKGISFLQYKDRVIFEKSEILKTNQEPYTIYTPYKNQWLKKFANERLTINETEPFLKNFYKNKFEFPSIEELGFRFSTIKVRDYSLVSIADYSKNRDIPSFDGTSFLGPHLRFGTASIRQIVSKLQKSDLVFLSELIWREFFMQILANFPRVVNENFKINYKNVDWRNNPHEFEKWCKGETGYPLVDAGMRQLNETGYMHNRVRMVAASFLCKHLLIDWRWGEAYFAQKLLDYELSSNNGNWQWAAGTGCDAAPYFRVFNPIIQQKKFDPSMVYIRKWIKDIDSGSYPEPMVEHSMARQRAIETYKAALNLK